LIGLNKKIWPIYFHKDTFTIGLLFGESPFDLREREKNVNPIIRPEDITDFHCRFVADPFLYKHNAKWFIFYEAMDMKNHRAKICYSYSTDTQNWFYGGIAIEEKFHLSYPYIFNHENKLFMLPETNRKYEIRLYECRNFPDKWEQCNVLLKGRYTDPSITLHDGVWYLFLTETGSNILRLFYSDKLFKDWFEHPKSPIVIDDRARARSAGKIITYGTRLYRFSQDCTKIYGENVRAHEIIKLNKTEYSEKEYSEKPILHPTGKGWNAHRTHHLHAIEEAPGNWIAVVDGLEKKQGIFIK